MFSYSTIIHYCQIISPIVVHLSTGTNNIADTQTHVLTRPYSHDSGVCSQGSARCVHTGGHTGEIKFPNLGSGRLPWPKSG